VNLVLPRIYPIINVTAEDDDTLARAVELACRFARCGISLVQLRAKPLPAGALTELAAVLVERTSALDCRIIVNDRADVALAAGAAGVHVGDTDIPVDHARAILGPERIVGTSTHSLDDVRAAATTSADYIGFGPVFESPTKPGARDPRGLDLLRQACAFSAKPVCAIGGITSTNARAAWVAGAASVASISDFERAASVEQLVQRYHEQIPAGLP